MSFSSLKMTKVFLLFFTFLILCVKTKLIKNINVAENALFLNKIGGKNKNILDTEYIEHVDVGK